RITTFAFFCNGLPQVVTFNASSLGTSASRFIQGAEISLFQNPGGLQYIVLNALSDPAKTLLTLSLSDNHASNQFTGFIQAPLSAGIMPFSLVGSCTGGGQVQGLVTIWFFS